jgi:chaperonin GroEL
MFNDDDKAETTTKILFGSEARNKLFEGLKEAADAVTTTLGPKGSLVLIQQPNGLPTITKDGITVARSINFKDPLKKMGAQLICEAAAKTNDVSGDGTTTATLLTYSLVYESNKLLAAGISSLALKNGITKASARLDAAIEKISKPISTKEEIMQIATISANNDKETGKIIADAVSAVGVHGSVQIENGRSTSTTLDITNGMKVERGFISPYFVNNSEKMQSVLENPFIMIVDQKIDSLQDIVPILEKIHRDGKSLFIIANDFDETVAAALVQNKLKGVLNVCAIKSPGVGSTKDSLLSDIATLCGGQIISHKTGTTFKTATLESLGKCAKIICGRNNTVFIEDGSTKANIDTKVDELTKQAALDVSLSENDLGFLKQRISMLSSGVAVIRVGGYTELEVKEKTYRIEDALNATKAAIEEGIIPGGGTALIRAAFLCDFKFDSLEESYGGEIVKKLCFAPFEKIVTNCGKSCAVLLKEIKEKYAHAFANAKSDDIEAALKEIPNYGYNLATDKISDMFEDGIVDPAKVLKTALKNAVSVATTIISLDAVVYDEIKN